MVIKLIKTLYLSSASLSISKDAHVVTVDHRHNKMLCVLEHIRLCVAILTTKYLLKVTEQSKKE